MRIILLLLLLTTTALAQQPCWVNSAGNLECLPFKIKEFSQHIINDTENWPKLFAAKSDSLDKCIKASEQFVKDAQAKIALDKEQYAIRERSLLKTAENDVKIALAEYKSKWWNSPVFLMLVGAGVGGWIVSEIKE